MKPLPLAALIALTGAAALAQEHRELGAHVHGVSRLQVAVEGGSVAVDLLSPGMDLVGFEHVAVDPASKDAVERAIRLLLQPDEILVLEGAAACRLVAASAHLHGGAHEDEEHDHEDEGHEHEEGASHSEFHATYSYECDNPGALTAIAFPFFAHFPQAMEIEAEYITAPGAGAVEIPRDQAEMALE